MSGHWKINYNSTQERDHSPAKQMDTMDHSKMDHSKVAGNKMAGNKMNHSKMIEPIGSNPCTDKLTDIEYLVHMIPHHQVAIDMSDMLIPKSTDPIMLHLCRDIIRKQKYEIWEMGLMKSKLPASIFSSQNSFKEDFITKMDLHSPKMSKAKDGPCNPLFFKPNDHSSHMKGMIITDKSYLEHMIPHHQVAVDMSRRLLLHTNHPYLMDFCRKLIIDQQGEIFYMNSLLKNSYNYQSELLN
jgi:uncharacterized protein (DUF305 family)